MAQNLRIERDLLAKVFDIATTSLDFGSGFLDDEQVEALRTTAVMLNVDPLVATPANYVCKYTGEHEWSTYGTVTGPGGERPYCWRCRTEGSATQPRARA